jgi:hypothetical protein
MFQKKQPPIPRDNCGSSGTKQPFTTQVDWKVFQQEAAGAGADRPPLFRESSPRKMANRVYNAAG